MTIKFEPTKPDLVKPVFCRMVGKDSEGKEWEVGVKPVLYGYRISFGAVNDRVGYQFDLCAGNNLFRLIEIYAAAIALLERQPDGFDYRLARTLIPQFEVKPIWKSMNYENFIEEDSKEWSTDRFERVLRTGIYDFVIIHQF